MPHFPIGIHDLQGSFSFYLLFFYMLDSSFYILNSHLQYGDQKILVFVSLVF